MKKILAIVALVVLLCGAAGARYLQVAVNHIGTGETVTSPDKKYEAAARAWWSESFWGSKRHWFEFSVRNARSGNIIRTIETTPIKGPPFGSRSSHSVIKWKETSDAVTFTFPDIEIQMTVHPDSD